MRNCSTDRTPLAQTELNSPSRIHRRQDRQNQVRLEPDGIEAVEHVLPVDEQYQLAARSHRRDRPAQAESVHVIIMARLLGAAGAVDYLDLSHRPPGGMERGP